MTTDAKPIPAHTDCPTCPDCSSPCGTRLDDTALAVDTFLDAGKLRCSYCGHHWEASEADLAQAAAADAAWLRKEAEDAGAGSPPAISLATMLDLLAEGS